MRERKESYGEFIASEERLRQRLLNCMRELVISARAITKETGIATTTISNFLNKKRVPQFTTLAKLEKYIEKKEDEAKGK